MELLIRLFAALLLDILANDFFIPMTPDGTDKVDFRPEFPPHHCFLTAGTLLNTSRAVMLLMILTILVGL